MYPTVCRIPDHKTLMNSIKSPTRCASSCMWFSTSPVVLPSRPAALRRIVLRHRRPERALDAVPEACDVGRVHLLEYRAQH